MKIRTTVLCLPITDIGRSLDFYKAVFAMPDTKAEEGMIVLELPHLSLFLMAQEAYETYSKKVGRDASVPNSSAPHIISCAVDTKEDVDAAVGMAREHGGMSMEPAAIDSATGGYIGYIADPDGHVWELVHPKN